MFEISARHQNFPEMKLPTDHRTPVLKLLTLPSSVSLWLCGENSFGSGCAAPCLSAANNALAHPQYQAGNVVVLPREPHERVHR